MAAAIRHAARRIGGGALQRTTTRLASTKVGLTADQKVDATIRLVLIDKKTEELYDLIAGFKSKYALKGSLGQNQSSLLNQLSVQIQPRRHDPRWYSPKHELFSLSLSLSDNICICSVP
jgi:hypothetical protein